MSPTDAAAAAMRRTSADSMGSSPRPVTALLGVASLLAASATYLGAVSNFGWALFVLPTVLISAFFGWRVGRRSGFWQGWLAGLVFAFGLAVMIKISGYSQGGSVARSPLFAGTLGAGALAALARSHVATFAGLIAGVVVAGWSITGSQYHPMIVSVTVGLVLATLTVEEHRRQRWADRRRRGGAWLGVVVAAAVATATAIALIPPPPPDPDQPMPAPIPTQTLWSRVVNDLLGITIDARTLLVLVLLLLVVLVSVGARLRQSIRARRLRRSLAEAAPSASVANAWAWMLVEVRRLGAPVPLSLSPDCAKQFADPLLDGTRPQWLELGTLAQEAAFAAAPRTTPQDAARAWDLADQVVSGTARSRTLSRKLRDLVWWTSSGPGAAVRPG